MARVIIKDRGWDKLVGNARRLQNASISVGILDSATPESGSDISMAELAAVHEFGAPSVGIPERSFIRSALDEGDAKIQAAKRRIVGGVMDGKLEPERGLHALGQLCKTLIQQKIIAGPFVPNAPSTIRQKGSSRPLVDTGRLRASVDYVVNIGGEAGGAGSGEPGSGEH